MAHEAAWDFCKKTSSPCSLYSCGLVCESNPV